MRRPAVIGDDSSDGSGDGATTGVSAKRPGAGPPRGGSGCSWSAASSASPS
jgi:hypothetical protein